MAIVMLMAMSAAGHAQPSACTPAFAYQQPWQGADVAYSIPLGRGGDLWIFGDTLYGDKREVTGRGPRMVRNSIGISTCRHGQWHIDYVMRHDSGGRLLDFFTSQHAGTWYWAFDGVVHSHEVWVTLTRVRKASGRANPLGFEICGTDLAHVTGLDRDPQQWTISYLPLVPASKLANPTASAVVHGNYVYLYTQDDTSHATLLTRIALAGLGDPQAHLESFGADGAWHRGLDAGRTRHVMQRGASEMSVRYHPELKKWLAVLVDPVFGSDKVLLRSADSLEGPWGEDEVVYHIPELQKDWPGYDADTFCYAGKEHPEFERPGQLLFSYVCNTMQPKKLVTETNIYLPRVVRQPMPTSLGK
jgi:hypothetical protein